MALFRSLLAPTRPRRLLGLLLLVLLLPGLTSSPLLAAKPAPPIHIGLDTLGYVPFSAPVLSSGSSLLTLNYVDDTHLLVTFSVRRLLKRIPGDPAEDVDRSIDAVLVELPSGDVLARTAWRVHDPAQYLWPLGNGNFLLRIRDRLSTISPLLNLKSGDAFKERHLISSERPIGAILLSPDASLLILESLDRRPGSPAVRTPRPGTSAAAAQATQTSAEVKPLERRNSVEVHFYRLHSENHDAGIFAQSSGTLAARSIVTIPADGSGFLSVLDQSHQHWAFNYNFYRGHVEELSPFDSTCRPLPVFVSRSEFIAFGCRTGEQRQMFGGFNLRGEEMWEQGIPETFLNPSFAFAPSAGRFAFGRSTTAGAVGDTLSTSAGQFTAQTVTVFQTDSGKQILHLDCSPILSAGQNFDLSPDGANLAIIRNATIEIHPLPTLSAKDRAGVTKALSLAPAPGEGPVQLLAPLSRSEAREATAAGTPVPTPPLDQASQRPSAIVDSDTGISGPETTTPETTPSGGRPPETTTPAAVSAPAPAPPAPVETHTIENGDPQPRTDLPRKPPTLYNPGEHTDPAGEPTSGQHKPNA